MQHSNLIRVLLLFTLVGTLSSDYALKATAQVTNNSSSNIVKQSHQDILQKTEIIQQKAQNFRQTVDKINIQLQEQLNTSPGHKIVDIKQVLDDWEELNIIWHNFAQDIEKNPELTNLLQENKVFQNITQNLISQKQIISNLAKVLNNPSTLTIIDFQKQIFTKRELNNYEHIYGIFEEKSQYKFALVSTNKARELQLQISQIENTLSNYLLYKKQLPNPNYPIIQTSTKNLPNTESVAENSGKETNFFNFNILIVLALLSSCGIFIALRAYKKNSSSLAKQNLNQNGNTETSNNDIADYLKNVQKVESQARELLSSTDQIIEKSPELPINEFNEYFEEISAQRSESSSDFPSFPRGETFSHTRQHGIQESLSITKTLTTEEDVIVLYRKNRQLLLKKAIRVDVTSDSIQRIKSGIKSAIMFEKASSGSYWIIVEPKLENNCYFLVPNPMLNLNVLIDQSIDKVFTCSRYNNRTSDSFKLKFPAMVQGKSSSSWKLVGTGEITFS